MTLKQAIWSTFFSGGLGLVLGLWVGRLTLGRTFDRVLSLMALPMSVPTVVAALAWVFWMGRSGFLASWGAELGVRLDWAYSFKAVILAHAFYNIPWVALCVAHARRMVPVAQLEALATLGAGRLSVFYQGVWPYVRWSWAAACAQVMGLCSMSFALVLVLGGGPPVQTLETEVYARLRYGALDLTGALACAFWELILTLLPWGMVLFFERREKVKVRQTVKRSVPVSFLDWEGPMFRSTPNRVFRPLVFGVGVFFLVPYLPIFFGRFTEVRGDLSSALLWRALRLSLSLSFVSSVLTLLTAFLVLTVMSQATVGPRGRSVLSVLFNLPSGLSVIILGLGLWIAYGRWTDPFGGAPALMILLQMTLFFPLALSVLSPVASATDSKQMEAAMSLGASWVSAWWEVEWVRWKGPVLMAFGSVFGGCLGEVGAVTLFASDQWVSLPLLISRSMQRYHFGQAQTLAALLLGCVFVITLGANEIGQRISRTKS
jgi:thiamine transport system permease protein